MWSQGTCPVCEGSDAVSVATLRDVPASAGRLCASADEAARIAAPDVRVAVCRNCGYIGNEAFDPTLVGFGAGYDVSLDGSPTYRRFLDQLAEALFDHHGLRGKNVLELACGSGSFLRRLALLGIARGTGIDPSASSERLERVGDAELRFVRAPADASMDLGADFVCCRHLLHEVARPRELLHKTRSALGSAHDRAVYFEVPNAADIFAEPAPWRLMYEYASYFTAECLRDLFASCGFRTLRVAPCYADGQYLGIEAAPAPAGDHAPWKAVQRSRRGAVSAQRLRELIDFGRGIGRTLEAWEARLDDLARRGERIAVWGAGGRGLNFLALLAAARAVGCVVDINPSRQGGFVPRSAHMVMAPEALIDFRPSVVIVTNPTYRAEIERQLAEMRLSCATLSI